MTLVFLALVVVLAAVGISVLSVKSRQPNSIDSGIDSFQREMRALAPPPRSPYKPEHAVPGDAADQQSDDDTADRRSSET